MRHPVTSFRSTCIPHVMIKKLGFFTLLLFITPAFLNAQWMSDTLYYEFDEIEVTATKTPRTLSEIPGRVDVLSAEVMATVPAVNLVYQLRTLSGINTSGSFGLFTMSPNVTLRGLSGEEQSRTLVMMDGMPLNKSDTGGVNWNSINTANVKQVEVYKGPGSSLYGSNAMGGVINIITKTPDSPFSANAGLSYGTYNTYQGNLNLSSKPTERLTLHLDGFYVNSDGYISAPDSLKTDFDAARFVDEGGVSAKAGYRFSELFNVQAGYDLFLNKRGDGIQITGSGMYRKFDTNRARFNVRGEQSHFRYALNMFFQREDYFRVSERMRGDTYTRFNVESERDDWGVSLDLFQDIGSHSLAGGIEFKTGSVDGGDFYQTSDDVVINRGSMSYLSGYLQDEINMLDRRLFLQLGLRYDYVTFYNGFFEATTPRLSGYNGELDSNNWSTISPRAALRFNPENRTFSGYVSYARGFRASILDDLSRTGILWGRDKIANPELGPETLDNFEIGMDFRPVWNMIISPTLFYSHGNDFLYFVEMPDDDSVFRRENVSSVQVAGAEIDLRYFVNNAVTITGSYTLNHSEILSFPERPDMEGNQLTFSPRHQLKGSLNWRNRIADIGFTAFYKGSQFISDDNAQKIDPYTTFDIMASRQIFDSMRLSLEVMDIMDNRFMESLVDMSPGRFINFKVGYEW